MRTIKPSWIYTTILDEHNSLFQDANIQTKYIVDTYICKCGRNEFIVRDEKKVEYRCKTCRNQTFLNVGLIWNDLPRFINDLRSRKLQVDFTLEFGIYKKDKGLVLAAITKIPCNIDFVKKEIIYDDFILHYGIFDKNAKIISNINLPKNSNINLKKELTKAIKDQKHLEKYIDFRLPNKPSASKLKDICFFLKYQNLKDYRFIKWLHVDILQGDDLTVEQALDGLSANTNKKSVKKAVYQNYNDQLEKYRYYDPMLVSLFTKYIQDPNHIVTLLKIDFSIDLIEEHNSYTTLEYFIEFLLKYYSQKQIVQYFQKLQDEEKYLINDTLVDFAYIQANLENGFQKCKCSPHEIHNQFVKIARRKRYSTTDNQSLEYTQDQLLACTDVESYSVRLPYSSAELFEWADILHNCMASYFDRIKDEYTIIYGFFLKNQLKFAVEIQHNRIVQIKGKYNKNIPYKEEHMIRKWKKQYFTIEEKPIEKNKQIDLKTIEDYIEKFKSNMNKEGKK